MKPTGSSLPLHRARRASVADLDLDRNLAAAHFAIGLGKILIGPAEETEAYIGDALRLSPRDMLAYIWMTYAGIAKLYLGSCEQAVARFRRTIEANRNYPLAYFHLAAALAELSRLDDAHSAVRVGLTLNPTFTISRARANWTAMSDKPTHLAQIERVLGRSRRTMIAARRLLRSLPPTLLATRGSWAGMRPARRMRCASDARRRRRSSPGAAAASSRQWATVSCLSFALSLPPSNAPSRPQADCRAATPAFPKAHAFPTASASAWAPY